MGTRTNENPKTNRRVVWIILVVLGIGLLPLAGYCYISSAVINQLGDRWEPYNPMDHILAAAPEWTPDGSRIVFGHGGSIYVVNQDGSALNRIHGSGGDDDLYHTPAISGDGSRIAYSKYQGDQRWERLSSTLDGAEVRETSENLDRGFKYLLPPSGPYSVSPDRSRIAFVEMETRGANNRQVRVLYVSENPKEEDGSGWTELAEGERIKSPRWSPDGSQLAFVKLSLVLSDDGSYLYKTQVVSLNGSDLDTVHQVADGLGEYFDFSSGKHVAGYVDSPYGFYDAAWSPDGAKLLISVSSSISVVNADGSGLRTLVKLQDNPTRQLHPSWSPDGSMIAVYNGNAYEGVLFTMSPDGSNKRVLTEYGDPLRLAQNQSWDPAFDATPMPTVTPTPSATPTPTPKPPTPSPTAKPSPPIFTPTPAHEIAPPTTRADTPGAAYGQGGRFPNPSSV